MSAVRHLVYVVNKLCVLMNQGHTIVLVWMDFILQQESCGRWVSHFVKVSNSCIQINWEKWQFKHINVFSDILTGLQDILDAIVPPEVSPADINCCLFIVQWKHCDFLDFRRLYLSVMGQIISIQSRNAKNTHQTHLLQGQTKERAFLGNMDQQLKNNTGVVLPEAVWRKCFCF